MKKIGTRALAWILTLMMLYSALPVSALAAEYGASGDAKTETTETVPTGEASDKQGTTAPASGVGETAPSQTSDSGISTASLGDPMPASVVDPEEDTEHYRTYIYKVNGTKVSEQIVKNGDTLLEPVTPAVPEGQKFLGWYVGDTELTFGTVSGITADGEVTVEAKFSKVYYAYFMTVAGTDGTSAVYKTLEATSENNFTVTAPSDYEPAGRRVVSWQNGTTVATGASVTLTADTTFTPNTVECVWVTYDTDGAGHVESQYADKGETVTLSTATPKRTG